MKRTRRSRLTLTTGDTNKLVQGKDYFGVWSGVDVRWKLPSGTFIAISKYPIGGWNVPCRICKDAKGLIVHAYETGSEEM